MFFFLKKITPAIGMSSAAEDFTNIYKYRSQGVLGLRTAICELHVCCSMIEPTTLSVVESALVTA